VSNKSILVLGTPFFGYIDRIVNRLKLKCPSVDLRYTFTDDIFSRFIRFNSNRYHFLYDQYQLKYYEKLFRRLKSNYDVVFVLNGTTIPLEVLELLKVKYVNARFILYLWDDISNVNHEIEFYKLFDKVFTYSKIDSSCTNFIFRPFFYSNVIDSPKISDLSFVGTLHGDRDVYLSKVQNYNSELSVQKYIYSDFFSYIKKIRTVKLNYTEVNFKKLNYYNYLDILASSKATIELPRVDQLNITTRAIEVLGTKTKLITRSNAVETYDFYNKSNIFIINDNIYDIKEWLKIPYEKYDTDLLYKYSIESWINDVVLSNCE
jgi:hypothetical protein